MQFLEKIYDYFLGRDVAYFIGGATFYISLSIVYPDLFNFTLNNLQIKWGYFSLHLYSGISRG